MTENPYGYFAAKLAFETDPADVWAAMRAGEPGFVLADCRTADNHAKTRIPGAISLPWQEITEERIKEGHPTEGRRPVHHRAEGPDDWGIEES